ncbi:MAG TPA: thiamine-phosphate kinase [Edaphobacter sp.]
MSRRAPQIAGELSLIEQIRRTFPSRGRSVTLGIGDDCAILRPPANHEILVTTDFSLEGRHFRRDLHPPASVGHRCLARGLSDLAAMGGTPVAAFLSLALPNGLLASNKGRRWVAGFFKGMRDLAAEHSTPLAGGDTASSPTDLILADIVLIGSAPGGKALRRSGARPGDAIYVTGALGGAHAELTALLSSNRPSRATTAAPHPHFYPQPRLAVGAALLKKRLATSAIDLSDGLSTDLMHLCKSSNVAAAIDRASLPLHSLLAKLPPDDALHAAIHGGEDYELLFTAPAAKRIPQRIAGVTITRIGTVLRKQRDRSTMTLIETDGKRRELKPAGWQHLTGR